VPSWISICGTQEMRLCLPGFQSVALRRCGCASLDFNLWHSGDAAVPPWIPTCGTKEMRLCFRGFARDSQSVKYCLLSVSIPLHSAGTTEALFSADSPVCSPQAHRLQKGAGPASRVPA